MKARVTSILGLVKRPPNTTFTTIGRQHSFEGGTETEEAILLEERVPEKRYRRLELLSKDFVGCSDIHESAASKVAQLLGLSAQSA